MFSNFIFNDKKFVLFVDEIGLEHQSDRIIGKCLQEQNITNPLRFPANSNVTFVSNLQTLCSTDYPILENNTYVILRPISKLIQEYKISEIFQIINKFNKNVRVKQIFAWLTVKNISEHFIINFLEHMADMIIKFEINNELSILRKKSRGIGSLKNYSYQIQNESIQLKEIKKVVQKPVEPTVNPENLGTFKIGLEDEELVARNALQLPYEKARITNDVKESKIIYQPEPDDDYFDDEDPDDDLDV